MTRREIILQILSEASGRPPEQVEELFAVMLAREMLSDRGLDERFSEAEARQMLIDFRGELPGIRRWLVEEGLLEESGHA